MRNVVDVNQPEYWDPVSLDQEMRRIFEVCHSCRRCWNLCPSFPALFEVTDPVDGDVAKTDAKLFSPVVDLCYQCKLCYNHCPYTPPHEYQLDFPRLLTRAKLQRVRKEGVKLVDRLTGDTKRIGTIASPMAPVFNAMNKSKVNRFFMEKTVGIHHSRALPMYHRETFSSWVDKNRAAVERKLENPAGKVALFYTSPVNYNTPEVGKALVAVFQKNNIEMVVPPQKCCGMPFLDGGNLKRATENATDNVKVLAELVGKGYDVVAPGPSCSLVIKDEYPHILGTPEARLVAEHTFDSGHYLSLLLTKGKLNTEFKKGLGKVAYHFPCHLRHQRFGDAAAQLLRKVPGTQVTVIEQCSAHDGTWSMKKQYFELSMKVGGKLFDGIKEVGPDLVVSDCPLAGIQIEQGTGMKPVHPLQALQVAYGI